LGLYSLHIAEYNTVTCWSDYRRGFGLLIGFIDHVQVVKTINYNTTKITVNIADK
jgi:hypothetical protein